MVPHSRRAAVAPGVSKRTDRIDLWARDVDPSTEHRRWFHHDPERWAEFKRRHFKDSAPTERS